MVTEIKPVKKIERHIKLDPDNYIFLSGIMTDLLVYGYNSNYSELINLSIETLNRLLNQSGSDKEAKIKQLYEIIESTKKQ